MAETNSQVEPTTTDPTDPQTDPQQSEMIPRSEAQKAFKARDLARRQVALLTRSLGLEASDIKLVATNDEADPYRLDSPALAKLSEMAKGLVSDQTAKHSAIIDSQDRFISRQLIDEKLRSALTTAGALDPLGTGEFSDIIQLLRGRIKAERGVDEMGELTFDLQILDNKGKPAPTLDLPKLVGEFLDARPALRKAQRRSGIGAGGAANVPANARGALSSQERGAAAADRVFGAMGRDAAVARRARTPSGEKAANFIFGKIGSSEQTRQS